MPNRPERYSPLPKGQRCRCVHAWVERDGSYWCCNAGADREIQFSRPKLLRVIIESPYAGDIEANTAYAKRAVMDSLHRGEAPIASHLLFPQPGILKEAEPAERRLGIDAGHAWLPAAQLVAFYLDRGESPGMAQARLRARDAGISTENRMIGPGEAPSRAVGPFSTAGEAGVLSAGG
jgi:hypothetical protein